MSVAKIIEISSASETSFQDAIEQGIQRVNKTVKNVEGVWIKEQKVEVKNGSIVSYRVDMKVTFLLNDDA
ncbi:MAG: dodecin family protein [Candidatus Sumerlaeota bacterium]